MLLGSARTGKNGSTARLSPSVKRDLAVQGFLPSLVGALGVPEQKRPPDSTPHTMAGTGIGEVAHETRNVGAVGSNGMPIDAVDGNSNHGGVRQDDMQLLAALGGNPAVALTGKSGDISESGSPARGYPERARIAAAQANASESLANAAGVASTAPVASVGRIREAFDSQSLESPMTFRIIEGLPWGNVPTKLASPSLLIPNILVETAAHQRNPMDLNPSGSGVTKNETVFEALESKRLAGFSPVIDKQVVEGPQGSGFSEPGQSATSILSSAGAREISTPERTLMDLIDPIKAGANNRMISGSPPFSPVDRPGVVPNSNQLIADESGASPETGGSKPQTIKLEQGQNAQSKTDAVSTGLNTPTPAGTTGDTLSAARVSNLNQSPHLDMENGNTASDLIRDGESVPSLDTEEPVALSSGKQDAHSQRDAVQEESFPASLRGEIFPSSVSDFHHVADAGDGTFTAGGAIAGGRSLRWQAFDSRGGEADTGDHHEEPTGKTSDAHSHLNNTKTASEPQAKESPNDSERQAEVQNSPPGVPKAVSLPATQTSGPDANSPASILQKNLPDVRAIFGLVETGLIDTISRETATVLQRGISELKVKLQPEILGDVSLKVRLEDDKLTAQIQATRPEVRTALEVSIPQLRDALAIRGIEVQRVDIYGSGDAPAGESRWHQNLRQKFSARQRDAENAGEREKGTRFMGYNTIEVTM